MTIEVRVPMKLRLGGHSGQWGHKQRVGDRNSGLANCGWEYELSMTMRSRCANPIEHAGGA